MQISRSNGLQNASVANDYSSKRHKRPVSAPASGNSVTSKEKRTTQRQNSENQKLLAKLPAAQPTGQQSFTELNTKELKINSQYTQYLPELVSPSIMTAGEFAHDSIRGRLVTDGHTTLSKTAIQTYQNNQSLEDVQHVSDLMGIDIYV